MANPFAAAASSNPFAAATAAAPAAANPFATAAAPAAANPFATAASTAASNPFAAATTTTTAANPFAAVTTTSTAANPFAAVTTTSTAANPFATAAAPAPASANPFATAAAPAAANPFATATTAAANPFATAGAATATAGAAATIISPQLINDVHELRAVYMPDLSRLSQYKQFKHILYNLRDPRIDRYNKPPELSQQEWDLAQKTAPDAFGGSLRGDRSGGDFQDDDGTWMSRKRARSNEKLVPVAVIGFKGLKDRMDQQDRIVGQFTKMADQLASTLHEMELESEKSKDLISQLRHKHTLLSQRLIRVMEMVDRVLSKGMALDRNEVKLRNRLEAVRERLNRPTEFKARLNELMALQRMQGERRRARASLAANDMREILDRLKAQRLGLSHLTRIVRRDARDIAIMLRPHKALDVAQAAEAIRQQRTRRQAW